MHKVYHYIIKQQTEKNIFKTKPPISGKILGNIELPISILNTDMNRR